MSLLLLSPRVRTREQFGIAVDEALRPLTVSARRLRLCFWLMHWTSISESQAEVLFERLKQHASDAQIFHQCVVAMITQVESHLSPVVQRLLQSTVESPNSTGSDKEMILQTIDLEHHPSHTRVKLADLDRLDKLRFGLTLKTHLKPHSEYVKDMWERLDDPGATSDETIYDLALWIILTDMICTRAEDWTPVAKLEENHPARLVLDVVPEWSEFLAVYHHKSEPMEWIAEHMKILETALSIDWFCQGTATQIIAAIEAADLRRVSRNFRSISDINPSLVMDIWRSQLDKSAEELKVATYRQPPTFHEYLRELENSLDEMITLARVKRQIIDMWEIARSRSFYPKPFA